MDEGAASPVYAVYFPADIAKSPRNVFTSLKDAVKFANSPEGKSNGARFNRFGTPKEAMDFFDAGVCRSPAPLPSTPAVPSEPTIPHPSVSRLQMNDLKRAIEKGTVEAVCDLINSNPRFLVNTNGDTAAIVMEGFRFNALHIAARHGKADVVRRILELVSDIDFLAALYGTSREDAQFRAENIVTSYLNTPDKNSRVPSFVDLFGDERAYALIEIPDAHWPAQNKEKEGTTGCGSFIFSVKGNWETPLHLAAKFGHVDVVRALVNQPLMKKEQLNIEGKTALEIACSRYTGDDKRKRKDEMELLLGGFFVAVYRSVDNSLPARIISSESFPKCTLPNNNNGICSPLLPDFQLSGYAGPFGSKDKAAQFLTAWVGSEKHVKLSDVDKGYERVGRELSEKHRVKWAESWCFLDRFVDLRSDDGLELLNSYLGCVKQKETQSSTDGLRKRLTFDDEDEIPHCLTPSDEEFVDDDDDEFEDAVDEIDEKALNDSLAGLAERLGTLTLNSPSTNIERNVSRGVPNDLGEFFTPPATPPPVFLLDHPTKVDNDVMIALARVPQEKIDLFPHVRQFTEKLRRVSNRVRSEWPALDSPRRAKASSRLFIN